MAPWSLLGRTPASVRPAAKLRWISALTPAGSGFGSSGFLRFLAVSDGSAIWPAVATGLRACGVRRHARQTGRQGRLPLHRPEELTVLPRGIAGEPEPVCRRIYPLKTARSRNFPIVRTRQSLLRRDRTFPQAVAGRPTSCPARRDPLQCRPVPQMQRATQRRQSSSVVVRGRAPPLINVRCANSSGAQENFRRNASFRVPIGVE